MSELTYLESIRKGLHKAMVNDSRVYLLGEDIIDPYGGAFKVTKNLSSEFPNRVLSTPISEAGITGVATGMAIRGLRPVVEIMFGDFITLCADQIINSATKFPLMYKDNVFVPMLIRTPMGGGRGYGPTHSQSLEKLFFGTPGLTILSPSLAHSPGDILCAAILKTNSPVLYIEDKNLYPMPLISKDENFTVKNFTEFTDYPVRIVDNFKVGKPDVIIIAYGGVSNVVIQSMKDLSSEEIMIRAIFPSQIDLWGESLNWLEAVSPDIPIVVAEQGSEGFNWGSEIVAALHTRYFDKLVCSPLRISALSTVIPAAKDLETEVIVSKSRIIDAIFKVIV
jgi:pyruvate/2-oxoglutarate/acetoin dehydrogenase E1 component